MVTGLKKLRLVILKATIWRNYSFGKGFHAGIGVRLWAKSTLKIGRNCYLGRYTQIECDAEIGDNVLMGNHVAFVGKYDHNYTQIGVPIRLASQIRDSDYSWLGLKSKATVKSDVWIGYGSIILSGVTIHEGAIVAAGSVVTKDVEPYSIVAGNPAKKIGFRFEKETDIFEHEKILTKKGWQN